MPEHKWDDTNYVRVYELVKGGIEGQEKLAAACGVGLKTFANWVGVKPALRDAMTRGKEARGQVGAKSQFMDFVFKRLPPKLQAKFNDIFALADDPNHYRRVKEMFAENGERSQQHMFLYAYSQHFNTSEALRICGMSKKKLDGWCQRDPEFAELCDEMQFHKKEFVEASLLNLVKAGDSAATIFASKTLNRDRGYGDKTTIEHTGTVEVQHRTVSIGDLELPLDVRRVILAAVRTALANNGQTPLPGEVVRDNTVTGHLAGP